MAKKKKKEKDMLDMDQNRFGLFMDEDMFNTEIDFGREYIHNDVGFQIKLYRINAVETKSDDLYGETKAHKKKFFPVVLLKGIVNIAPSQQHKNGDMTRDDSGELTFSFYIKDLEELEVDITRGDIVAYNPSGRKERYYEVSNANNVTDETVKTIAGMKPYWRKITAIPVKKDVVPFT